MNIQVVKDVLIIKESVIGKMKKIINKLSIIIFCIVCFCWFSNNYIQTNYYIYKNSKISQEFNNFKIAHISDLHNKDFGNSLINKIKKEKPNIIVITGDIIDSNNTNIDIALDFAKDCISITNTFYVSGNHEYNSNEYDLLKEKLIEIGVIVLDNEIYELSNNINIIGVSDISFSTLDNFKNILSNLANNDNFNILLSHRPELIDIYIENNIDLVFSGHTHGGQWRIPFINKGIIAPNQGFFPKYSEGMIVKNNTTMIVSRGLGNSIIPLRIFNQPELIITTLKIE